MNEENQDDHVQDIMLEEAFYSKPPKKERIKQMICPLKMIGDFTKSVIEENKEQFACEKENCMWYITDTRGYIPYIGCAICYKANNK